MTTPRRIPAPPSRDLLATGSAVTALVRQAHESMRYAALLRAIIDAPSAAHLVGVRLQDTNLTVLMDSPIWVARLRYRVPDLLRAWRGDPRLPALDEIRVRVATPPVAPPGRRAPPSGPGPAATELLRQLGESTPDPQLRSIFARLSRRSRRSTRSGSQTPAGSNSADSDGSHE